jgi:hypothetical protein
MHELLVFGTKTDSSHQPRTEIRSVESRVYPSISTFTRSLKPGDASRSPYLAPTRDALDGIAAKRSLISIRHGNKREKAFAVINEFVRASNAPLQFGVWIFSGMAFLRGSRQSTMGEQHHWFNCRHFFSCCVGDGTSFK